MKDLELSPPDAERHARPTSRDLPVDAIDWTLPPAPATSPRGDLADLCTDALIDAQSYRLLAQEALHALHRLTIVNRELTDRYQRLVDEARALRVEWLSQDGVHP